MGPGFTGYSHVAKLAQALASLTVIQYSERGPVFGDDAATCRVRRIFEDIDFGIISGKRTKW
jgi:hypothetical protein